MTEEKLTLDVEKIKEVHELKEDGRYIIVLPKAKQIVTDEFKVRLKDKYNIDAIIVGYDIKVYEVK